MMSETLGPQRAKLAQNYTVPRIIVGAWQLSVGHNINPTSAEAAIETLAAYAAAGFSTFDCADIYTGVEELLGEFSRLYKTSASQTEQSQIQIHTKYVPDRDALAQLSRAQTEQTIDRSLRRLGVDQLDLVQFSWWDYSIPRYVDCALWLNDLRTAGKIRHIGVTNFDVPRLFEILDAGVPVVSHQTQYSLLDHRPENGLVELCRERGIHLLCYGTLGGGFLSGRWLGAPEPGADLANRSLTKYRLMIEEFGGWTTFQELLRALDGIAKKHGVSIGNVATRYVLDMPQVAAAIVGARNQEHLQDNVQTQTLDLDNEDRSKLREYTVHRSQLGDVFGLEREPGGAHASIMRYNLNRD